LAAALPPDLFLREDYLLTAFAMFDKDSSGKIDMVEVGEVLQGDNSKTSKDTIIKYIKQIDTNGDG
jgi:Ca2+-binding EF-hand superfamily protein